MMAPFKFVRAWACYWIMQMISGPFYLLPRKYRPIRFINWATKPFFRYAGWWALRKNPNFPNDKLRPPARKELK